MKVEIATTQGRKLAAEFKRAGIDAQADSEGIMVSPRNSDEKKKAVSILLKHGMDKTDIEDGYPELLEAEQQDETETDFDYTINEDGSVTLGFGETEYDVSAEDMKELVEACTSTKKQVSESTFKSFVDFLTERKVLASTVPAHSAIDDFIE